MLGIASKIEPPTHSHSILISSTFIDHQKRSLPTQDYNVTFSVFSCSNVSFITVNHWLGFQLKGSEVQGYQIPMRYLSRDCT